MEYLVVPDLSLIIHKKNHYYTYFEYLFGKDKEEFDESLYQAFKKDNDISFLETVDFIQYLPSIFGRYIPPFYQKKVYRFLELVGRVYIEKTVTSGIMGLFKPAIDWIYRYIDTGFVYSLISYHYISGMRGIEDIISSKTFFPAIKEFRSSLKLNDRTLLIEDDKKKAWTYTPYYSTISPCQNNNVKDIIYLRLLSTPNISKPFLKLIERQYPCIDIQNFDTHLGTMNYINCLCINDSQSYHKNVVYSYFWDGFKQMIEVSGSSDLECMYFFDKEVSIRQRIQMFASILYNHEIFYSHILEPFNIQSKLEMLFGHQISLMNPSILDTSQFLFQSPLFCYVLFYSSMVSCDPKKDQPTPLQQYRKCFENELFDNDLLNREKIVRINHIATNPNEPEILSESYILAFAALLKSQLIDSFYLPMMGENRTLLSFLRIFVEEYKRIFNLSNEYDDDMIDSMTNVYYYSLILSREERSDIFSMHSRHFKAVTEDYEDPGNSNIIKAKTLPYVFHDLK